jgi:hypothetical protein
MISWRTTAVVRLGIDHYYHYIIMLYVGVTINTYPPNCSRGSPVFFEKYNNGVNNDKFPRQTTVVVRRSFQNVLTNRRN